MLAIAVVLAGLAVVGVVLYARAQESQSWSGSLSAYRLTLPRDVTPNQLASLFGTIAGITHRPGWSLLPLPPVVIETVSTSAGIGHVLLVSRSNQGAVLSAVRASLPGVRLQPLEDYQRPALSHARELTITSRIRPLAVDRAEATVLGLLSSLQPMARGAGLISQLILTSAGTPSPVKQAPSRSGGQGLSWLIDGEAAIDTEAVGQQRRKYETPLLHAVLRVGVAGTDRATGQRLISRSWGHYKALNAPGVRLVRSNLPSTVVARRLTGLRLPLLRWPLLLNARELVGLSGLPVGSAVVPGLVRGAARQLPAPSQLPRRGLVLAHSNYPGQLDRPLALATRERLMHQYIVGPTGSGKSWLLANVVLQDITEGRGTFVIDVKGDLISDILARVSPGDEERVVVIDPTNRTRPVGLNVLQHADNESSRELAVDNVVHIFRDLWSGFWGPRTDWVMRAGLSTLTLARTATGEQYTLVELSPLLTDDGFRRDVLGRADLSLDLRLFWDRYQRMSDGERSQVIGPTLNKLDAFTSRTAIRLLLGQSEGVDLTDIFTKRSAVLLSLNKGQLGSETTNLLGALSVAALWQATLTRAGVAATKRRPAFAVIDEAQDIVRLPLAIADMLAQARGYGLGITLANQYVAQLPDSVRRAILGTVRSQVAFALDYDDATVLERRFSPLTRDDLQGLQPYEVALRLSVAGQTLMPVTGTTLPLPDPTTDARLVAARAADRYGRSRADVEAAMTERRRPPAPPRGGFGREPRGGAA